MGARQVPDSRTATKLNALERQLAEQAAIAAKAQGKYDALFKQVWDIFDKEFGPNSRARFICADGYVIGRKVSKRKPTVDVEKLHAMIRRVLDEPEGGRKAARMIARITEYVPVVNQAALAKEVMAGRLKGTDVQRCVTEVSPVYSRERQPASSKDRQSIEAGILESPEDEEEESWMSA